MDNLAPESEFERTAADAYKRFAQTAAKYLFTFRRSAVTCGVKPCMVFLGNHSSGKSSIINWVLGENVQDTGLAPTDDGFTFILYGDGPDDFHGQAALDRLPPEFAGLKAFGDMFVHGLRVKFRPIEFLKSVTLVDSPGMIDSAEKSSGRDYDFEGVVRALAELCDMIFYLFDPDKPGTTGETVNIFAKCLSGVKFKLRILLNKCDGFSSMYDFARTYGTLCWNLASVLETKDMPKIWTVYSGETRENAPGSLDLSDFNRHRDEFADVFRDAPARRRDNLVSQTNADFRGLSIRMRILNFVWRRCFAARAAAWLAAAVLATAFAWFSHSETGGWTLSSAAMAVCAGLVASGAGFLAALMAARFVRTRLAKRIDEVFRREYRGEIEVGAHEDILRTWNDIREETAKIVQAVPLRLPFFGGFARWRLEKTRRRLEAAGRR